MLARVMESETNKCDSNTKEKVGFKIGEHIDLKLCLGALMNLLHSEAFQDIKEKSKA